MMRLVWSLLTATSGVASALLLYSASVPINQVDASTAGMTAATGGRQISYQAPAPTAPMQAGVGTILGIVSLVSLSKAVQGDVNSTGWPDSSDESLVTKHYEPAPPPPQPISIGTVRLSSHPDLGGIVHAGFVMITGSQGGGKSTIVGAIIRERIQMGHRVIVCNPHVAHGEYAPLEIYGLGDDSGAQFRHIAQGLELVINECNERYRVRQQQPKENWTFESEPITLVLEELGDYASGIDEPTFQNFMQTALTRFRKANIFVIGVTQSNTSVMTGRVKGLSELIKTKALTVEMLSKPSPTAVGGAEPTGFCNLYAFGKRPAMGVRMPRIEELLPHGVSPLDFRDLLGAIPTSMLDEDDEFEEDIPSPRDLIERSYALTSLTPAQQKVLDFAVKIGKPIDARIVARQNYSTLKGMRAVDIRNIFSDLAARGCGTVSEDSKFFIATS